MCHVFSVLLVPSLVSFTFFAISVSRLFAFNLSVHCTFSRFRPVFCIEALLDEPAVALPASHQICT